MEGYQKAGIAFGITGILVAGYSIYVIAKEFNKPPGIRNKTYINLFLVYLVFGIVIAVFGFFAKSIGQNQ